ncbi:MAG: deoxyribodipyrimidine photo-lyase, partial [Saprospiraceae bacterium]|nr:deoxyribodipyrimidine photo-lyase [Saprospiraceae bacterium]
PYVVFTPYKRSWLEKKASEEDSRKDLPTFPSTKHLGRLCKDEFAEPPSLESMGFKESAYIFPDKEIDKIVIRQYEKKRDFPAEDGTSRLGVHLRFGTISIRSLVNQVSGLNAVFLSELIWREFYSQILSYFPKVVEHSFRSKYDQIPWINDAEEFAKWCDGMTGYPMVDAGMRQLNQTGYMHNRVRMITASFLTKHLLIDWRWGEAYFAKKLLDYDLASNNGGWQWAAGCGTDAAPYFRIFNPITQQKKFDPQGEYVRKWIPELDDLTYPEPIVDHKWARERCLQTYKSALS